MTKTSRNRRVVHRLLKHQAENSFDTNGTKSYFVDKRTHSVVRFDTIKYNIKIIPHKREQSIHLKNHPTLLPIFEPLPDRA